MKVAVTLRAAVMLTVQLLALPEQEPTQPAKVLPVAACAVKVTEELAAKLPEHVLPQSMPLGELVTVPLPLPERATERA